MYEIEVWKDVTGYEGAYQVSNLGRVKSLQRVRRSRRDTNGAIVPERILRTSLLRGYHRVTLQKDCEIQYYILSRLVAIAFIPNPDNKPDVNHIDGDKSNNTSSNLEWVTKSENTIHAYKNKLLKVFLGEESPRGKLTNAQAEEIRNLYSTGEWTQVKLGEKYGIAGPTVSDIVLYKSYVK